ncbi:MAG TPA: M23 family metallopeptidase [Methylomirabilota bacterium]|nr:M23 family metallopeptidase [Methylomirabilota bacterium]
MRLPHLPALVALLLVAGVTLLATPTMTPPPPAVPPAPARPAPVETMLKRGETLEATLIRSGVGRADANGIVTAVRVSVNMRRLKPGERVVVARETEDGPVEVTWWRSPSERYEVRLEGARWAVQVVRIPVDTRVVALTGQLQDSLFASMDRLGESAALTAKLVSLFEWDFDFAADSLPGDRFRLLVEKRYAGGTFVGYGDILIAQYRSVGRPALTSLAFDDGRGETAYYDRSGRSVKKMFLRAPLDFTRITSGFSHARRHPILGGLHPHLAVDYGAPVGTPVRAVADGVVETAGWSGGYGLSITVRHARGYSTMYNHLSRIEVRRGERVRQREIIGRVGSTGLSTGPHLDYRVSRSGAFVNPLSEKFIPGAPISPQRHPFFQTHVASLLERLDLEAPFPAATR